MVRTLGQLDLTGKRVFVRVDFDVPLAGGRILDDARIRAALPTLEHALSRGAKVIVASHLGRPDGFEPELSLEPAAARLAELLDRDLRLADECVGDGVRKLLQELKNGEVLVLENLRFHPGEEANDPEFARQLAALCEVYVGEAFALAHCAHASNVGMVSQVAGPKAAGLRTRHEVDILSRLAGEPPRPFVAAVGGPRLSELARLVENLVPRADALLLGGAMACTFLAATKIGVGQTRIEEAKIDLARQILDRAAKRGLKVLLPVDHVCAESAQPAKKVVVDGAAIPEGLAAVDLGPRTRTEFALELSRARTAFWTGPMGLAEEDRWAEGTRAVARALAQVKGLSVVGGGAAATTLRALGLEDKVTHVSTGTDACLALIEGRELPGIKALE